ncbi:MAG: HEPN domain-containing protein [Acetivibrio sp.]
MQHDNQSDIGTIEDLAYHRLKVAKEDLETAEDNLRDNHLRAANNRAYYSIYHTITSILALEKTAFKKHKDTIAYFNKTYVKNEIFPRKLGREISIAEVVRHASDYDEFYMVSLEETERQINTAREFIHAAETYIQKDKI